MTNRYIYLKRDNFTEDEIWDKVSILTRTLAACDYDTLIRDEGVGVVIYFADREKELADTFLVVMDEDDYYSYLNCRDIWKKQDEENAE